MEKFFIFISIRVEKSCENYQGLYLCCRIKSLIDLTRFIVVLSKNYRFHSTILSPKPKKWPKTSISEF